MSGPADLSLVEAADAIANRDLTSMALLQACLVQLEKVDATLNTTIWRNDELAAASAMAADEVADAAFRNGEKLGPLHGIPLAHKDMFYQAGRPCTCGSSIRRDFVPDYTATVIDRLSAAGAFTFAGLNMAEFALNPTGHNITFGDCHNPWNPPYITGGSSSGSGAAVAARVTPASLGSDTGGSIRLPAAACGVTGLKPTQTRVSRHGVMPLSFSADNVGPLARTARDCARILAVIAGHDRHDPTSAREEVPDYEAALDGDLRGTRIGVPTNGLVDSSDAPIHDAFEEALRVLAARGARILRLNLPLMDAIATYGAVVFRAEAATIHARWMRQRPQDYAVYVSARMFSGYGIPATCYVEALSNRGAILKAFAREVFSQVDALALPTIPNCLPTLAETDIDRGPPSAETRFMTIAVNTRPFNYLGLPALSQPCGFDPNGLPIGLQLVARTFAEGHLLRLADAFQQDTRWHRLRPPVIDVEPASLPDASSLRRP